MTIFVLFFVELMAMRYATFGHDHEAEHSHTIGPGSDTPRSSRSERKSSIQRHTPGEDHLSHTREHVENEDVEGGKDSLASVPRSHQAHVEDYAAQMTGTYCY